MYTNISFAQIRQIAETIRSPTFTEFHVSVGNLPASSGAIILKELQSVCFQNVSFLNSPLLCNA